MPEGLTKAKALREKRANLREQEKTILDAASEEGRALTTEERESLDRIDADFRELTGDIQRIERAEEREREESRGQGAVTLEDGDARDNGDKPLDFNESFRRWALEGEQPAEQYRSRDPEARGAFAARMFTGTERQQYIRAQSIGTDSEGGYTGPQGFRPVLEDAMLAFGGIRQSRATILRTADGNQLEIPTLDDTSNTGALLAENAADAEQDMTFGQALLDAYKYTSKIIRVSKELLQDSAFDFNSLIGSKLAERLARKLATDFTTGTGSSQPEGIVTGATLGVTAAGTVAFTYAEILSLFHSVDRAYREVAEWMFNDTVQQAMRTLKNPDTNDYLWQESARVGAPDTLLNKPIRYNEAMADPAAAAKPILFGDMSKFFIRDVLDVSLVRLVERYAEYHQVGFVAISRHDSVLVDAGTNPIKYLQNAAA